MNWAKVKFFWDTMLGLTGSTLTATSTASGYAVNNIYNTLELNRWKGANTTDPHDFYFTAGANLMANGTFEGGATTSWSLAVSGSAAATFTASNVGPLAGTYSGYLAITNAGAGDTDIQVYQAGFSVERGKKYRVYFKSKAAVARTVRVVLMRAATPWDGYGLNKTFSLTTTSAGYTVSFTATETDANARLTFYCGGDINDVWVDDIKLSVACGADYLAILGHNLGTLVANVGLLNSVDGSSWSYIVSKRVTANTILLEEARLCNNGKFECWGGGLSGAVQPDGWFRGGTGSTCARSDDHPVPGTTRFSAALTRSGVDAQLYQRIDEIEYYKGKTLVFGCWVKASIANHARLRLEDGVSSGTYSAYHTGGGAWEFIVTPAKTFSVNATANNYYAGQVNTTDGTANFHGAVLKVATTLLSTDIPDCIQPGDAYTHWRLRIGNDDGAALAAAPEMAIAIWGEKTELDYCTSGYDPHAEDMHTNVVRGDTGYVLGTHDKWRERKMNLTFHSVDGAMYAKLKDWWDRNGVRNFFVGWELDNNPGDAYLMIPEKGRDWPFKQGGLYRDITINLTGRRE